MQAPSRPRRVLAGLILWIVALAMLAIAVALLLICLAGLALTLAGISSWLDHAEAASAWARTLGGVGLIGGSAGLAALGWLAVERLPGPLGRFAHLRYRVRPPVLDEETALQRARKFIAAIGILLALMCLPFAAAIHVTSHAPWLGWGG